MSILAKASSEYYHYQQQKAMNDEKRKLLEQQELARKQQDERLQRVGQWRPPSPPRSLESYIGGLGYSAPPPVRPRTGAKIKEEAIESYLKSIIGDEPTVKSPKSSPSGDLSTLTSSNLGFGLSDMDGEGYGRDYSPTGQGVLQGEVQFLKSALIRTEGNNRRLEKELSDFKTEFQDLMATLKGTAGSTGRGEEGDGSGLMDRHTAEVKIEEWVHKLFGDTRTGGRVGGKTMAHDDIGSTPASESDNHDDYEPDVTKVELDEVDIVEDLELKALLDSMVLEDIEIEDEPF